MNRKDLKLRVRALFARERVEAELEDEIQFHLAMQARKHRAQGVGKEDAARESQVDFGGVQRVKEECRDARGINLVETLYHDFRYALKSFRRTPVFAVTVIATIALGLGLNTALFTVFNAYVLRPFAVRDPYNLYQFGLDAKSGQAFLTQQDLRQATSLHWGFSEVLAYKPVFVKSAERTLFGNRVTSNYFSMLGVGMSMGRPFATQDGADSNAVVVLSHSAWSSKFASDPAIIGKTLPMFGGLYEVVGVAREGFNGVGQVPADFWIPQRAGSPASETWGQTYVARLAPGVSPEQAKASLLLVARQLTAALDEPQRVISVTLRSNATTVPLMPETVALFTPVALAFLLVLLVACANVASMMLGRSMARQREMGIRLSLGAGRLRLVRQLLVEGIVLAVPAAAIGFWISITTLRLAEGALRSNMPPMVSKMIRFVDLSPDRQVFYFLFGASLLAVLVFALLPALQVTRTSVVAASRGLLAEGGRPSRLRQTLVVVQVTVCALLLICAGVLLQAARQMSERDPGFQMANVAAVSLNQPLTAPVIESMRSQAWAEEIAVAWRGPLTGMLRRIPAAAVDGTASDKSSWITAGYSFVSPEYFDVLRIRILLGRNFTPGEASGEAPVVIVSESTTRKLWPGQNPLGKTLRIARSELQIDRANRVPTYRRAEVVGVSADVISGMVMEGKDTTCLYFPTSASGEQNEALLVRLRSSTPGDILALDSFLDSKAPSAILRVVSIEELFATQIYPFRVSASISSLLGGLALVLTLSGIYGVLSYLVIQRTREIGIRMALGATVSRVVGMVILQSARLAGVGAVLGGLLALGVSLIFASAVENVNTFDPLAYAAGIGTVLLAAFGAALVPSRKAASIEPSTTLRFDC